jgi:hypothetical protein
MRFWDFIFNSCLKAHPICIAAAGKNANFALEREHVIFKCRMLCKTRNYTGAYYIDYNRERFVSAFLYWSVVIAAVLVSNRKKRFASRRECGFAFMYAAA